MKNLKRLLFLIVWISLFVISVGYAGEIKNIARNPSFEDGTAEWQLLVTAPAAGKWESEKEGVTGKCVHITISAISGTDWHIEIHQPNQALKAGQKYTFNFWAKTADKKIRVVGPGIEYLGGSDWWETFNIDEKWKEFSKTWVQAAGGNATIHFGLGQSKEDIWLDHIRLYEGDYQKEDLEQFKEKQGIEPIAFINEASHKNAALELLEVMNTQKMLDQMMTSIEGMTQQQFATLDLPEEKREAAKAAQKEMMDWFSEFFVWEQMKDLYVDIYVEVFTENELKELIEFYKSPLGQKLLKKMPELTQKSMQKTQAILQQKMPEFQKRLQQTISELEEKHKDVESSNKPDAGDGK